jgi:hypothetical protein
MKIKAGMTSRYARFLLGLRDFVAVFGPCRHPGLHEVYRVILQRVILSLNELKIDDNLVTRF